MPKTVNVARKLLATIRQPRSESCETLPTAIFARFVCGGSVLSVAEAGRDLAMLVEQSRRQGRADFVQEAAGRFHFAAPFFGIDRQSLFQLAGVDLEAGQIEISARRHDSDRRATTLGAPVYPIEHPLEHAQILAIAGPEEMTAA